MTGKRKRNEEEKEMRKAKKLVSLAMTAVLTATSLVGCGGNNQFQASTPEKTTTGSSQQNTAQGGSSTSGEFSYPMSSTETLTYWCELNQNVSSNYSSLGETPFAQEVAK